MTSRISIVMLRFVVYTFWFRKKRNGAGRGFAPPQNTTIPIAQHHVTYYSVFATKKTTIYISFDILISCSTNVTILLKQQKNRVYCAKLCDIFNELQLYMTLGTQKKHALVTQKTYGTLFPFSSNSHNHMNLSPFVILFSTVTQSCCLIANSICSRCHLLF
jgi:hypothetical protein